MSNQRLGAFLERLVFGTVQEAALDDWIRLLSKIRAGQLTLNPPLSYPLTRNGPPCGGPGWPDGLSGERQRALDLERRAVLGIPNRS